MRNSKFRTLCFSYLIVLVLINASPSQAQVTSVTDFKSAIRTGNAATYLELVQQVFPDAEVESADGGAVAHKSIPLDQLFGDYKGTTYQEEMNISSIETPVEQKRNNGRLLVLIHVRSDNGGLTGWNEVAVLALFELVPSLKLLDAVDVQADKESEIWSERPLIQISKQTDAVVISNSHHNSSQGYQNLTIVAPVKGRIRNVFELGELLSSNDCGNNITQTASISSIKGTTRSYFNISVRVKSVKNPDDASCEKRTKGYTRTYNATAVWSESKGKYQKRGVALDQLSRFNEKRF